MQIQTLIRWPLVKNMTGLSRSTVYRLEQKGDFPQRINLTNQANGAIAWDELEVENWLKTRRRGVISENTKHTPNNTPTADNVEL